MGTCVGVPSDASALVPGPSPDVSHIRTERPFALRATHPGVLITYHAPTSRPTACALMSAASKWRPPGDWSARCRAELDTRDTWPLSGGIQPVRTERRPITVHPAGVSHTHNVPPHHLAVEVLDPWLRLEAPMPLHCFFVGEAQHRPPRTWDGFCPRTTRYEGVK